MQTILLIFILLAVLPALYFAYKTSAGSDNSTFTELRYKLNSFQQEIGRIETSVKNEIGTNRSESNEIAKQSRGEL